MIKKDPIELLCILFDIYSESPPEKVHHYNSPKKSISEANNDWFVKNKQRLNPLFYLPLSSRSEEQTMATVVEEATVDISDKARIRYVSQLSVLRNEVICGLACMYPLLTNTMSVL